VSPGLRVTAGAGAALLALLAAAGYVVSALEGQRAAFPQLALPLTMSVAYLGLGGVVLAHVPGHRAGRLMTAIGAASTVQVLALCWVAWTPAAWVAQWAWWLPLGLVPVALLGFPDAVLRSARQRAAAALLTAIAVGVSAALALAAVDEPRALVLGAGRLTPRAEVLAAAAAVGIAVTLLGLAAVAIQLVLRWRRSDATGRRQLLAVVVAGVAVLVGLLLDAAGLPVSWVVEGAALPVGMTVAILRFRLFDLDLVLSRTAVWLVMTGVVVVAYVAVVDLVGGVVAMGAGQLAAITLTALVAVAFEPVRGWVQRHADRLLFGGRAEPYAVLSRLGRNLQCVDDPAAVLPQLTEAITDALRLPYAGVELLGRHGEASVVARHGRDDLPVQRFPMVAGGQPVGSLLVAPRRVGEAFDRREERLLTDLARQAAVAAESVRLAVDLQRSRERLVLAREEERRRLRADLHDGVGPTLAALRLQLRAARDAGDLGPDGARVVSTLDEHLAACSRDLRTVVDRLRPPALDGGLVAALERETARFDCEQLAVELACPGQLPAVPAAVEVAAFRIAAEALTNVARHADARHCSVQLSVGRDLVLAVTDDGCGPGAASTDMAGVGVASMRERAEELGGTFRLEPAVPRGTQLEVRLPLHLTSAQEEQ
jgi:signal transduction histidine kinase